MRTGNNVTELVGHTPMVRINRLVGSGDAELWAKLETMNPGGSIKDRAALGRVAVFQRDGGAPLPSRYLAVETPHRVRG